MTVVKVCPDFGELGIDRQNREPDFGKSGIDRQNREPDFGESGVVAKIGIPMTPKENDGILLDEHSK